jgi:cell pole-organizing protein PopZ
MAVTEEKAQHEPTMEEILASIRRIISANGSDEPEADPEPANGFEAEGAQDDDAPSAEPEADEDDVLELTDRIEPEREPEPEPQPEPVETAHAAPEPAPAPQQDDSQPLLSPATTLASASSLSELADLLAGAGREPGFGGRSVEQLAAELLRPMLREWLDQNLPGMVETLVRAEIERLADLVKR